MSYKFFVAYLWLTISLVGCVSESIVVTATPLTAVTRSTATSTTTVLGLPAATTFPSPSLTATSQPNPTFTSTSTPFPIVSNTPTLTATASPILATHTPTPSASATLLPTETPHILINEALTPLSSAERVKPCLCETACPCQIEHVVIISIDGLRPDALELADTPTLDTLRAGGAYSAKAQSVLPAVTLVNHASMLGGMSPAKHGITWNTDESDRGLLIKGPTLFSELHEAGLKTAMLVGKPKLAQLVLPDSVDYYKYAGFTDQQIVTEALAVISTDMPRVLFIHLPDVDSSGHLNGWMHPEQLLTLKATDTLLAEIIAALESHAYLERTLLIITSDHGGEGKKHGSDIPQNVTIPWLAVGPHVPTGVILKADISSFDTAATVLYAFGLPIPEIWDGQPILEIVE